MHKPKRRGRISNANEIEAVEIEKEPHAPSRTMRKRFRCVRCKLRFKSVPDLMEHPCSDRSVTGVLAEYLSNKPIMVE